MEKENKRKMTQAELKRKLQVGTPLKMVYTSWGNDNKLNVIRYVVKIQGNGVYLNEDKEATKGSFLEFGKASLFEETEKGFKLFKPGFRDLNKEEKEILKNQPIDEEQEKIDIMTDGSQMFYRRQAYFKKCGFEYLGSCSKSIKGLYFTNGRIRDESIKGNLSIEYKLI